MSRDGQLAHLARLDVSPGRSRPAGLPSRRYVYDVRMLNERLQILVSTEQRRRLEEESKRRQASVGSLIRQAIDAHFGAVTPEDRLNALEGIRALEGRFLSPEELDRLVDEEREVGADRVLAR